MNPPFALLVFGFFVSDLQPTTRERHRLFDDTLHEFDELIVPEVKEVWSLAYYLAMIREYLMVLVLASVALHRNDQLADAENLSVSDFDVLKHRANFLNFEAKIVMVRDAE